MLLRLIGKEMKYQLKNITFYIFFAILILFYFTQYIPPSVNASLEPVFREDTQQQFYGYTNITDQTEQIRAVYRNMYHDWLRGEILKQGFIINKTVILNEQQLQALDEAMDSIYPAGPSSYTREEVKNGAGSMNLMNFDTAISYEEYTKLTTELDKVLGGNSSYSDKDIKDLFKRPMTYEEALSDFEVTKDKDAITRAYGRYFADYMGTVAGFFPIFIAAFVLTRDKRNRMHELIYSRKVSMLEYIFSKYMAISILLLLCFLPLAMHSTYIFYRIAQSNSYIIDYLAFFKYTFGWIFPTILFTTALGMLMSSIFNNGIAAIPVQFVLWAASMLPLMGNYSLTKILIRFNGIGRYADYINWTSSIITNRIFYTILSIALVFATAWIMSIKRRAVNGFSKLSKPDLSQHKAAS